MFPAWAAATQIVLPGVTEELVEGHTVFTVIEKARFANSTTEAAAVAVLVRERVAVRESFRGVLWFNDQYLVSPFVSLRDAPRYPCGGALIAVNAGDPDPRTMLVSYNQADQLTALRNDPNDPDDVLVQEDPAYENPDPVTYQQSGDYNFLGTPLDTGPYGEPGRQWDAPGAIDDPGTPGATPGAFQPGSNAWADFDASDSRITSSLLTGALQYIESYLVTDPNDHVWVIDTYDGIHTIAIDLTAPGTVVETASWFPIWVVNVLGKPVFTPDDGDRSCPPFVDDPWQQSAITRTADTAADAVCGLTTTTALPDACPYSPPGLGIDSDGDGVPVDGLDARPPAIGYYEPTDPATNGGATYCYDGNAPQGANAARGPGDGCDHSDGVNPLRLYNAVLYFYLGPEDVHIAAFAPHGDADTNGCAATLTYNGVAGPVPKAPTEWTCPGGDDDAEGNSHPFNPPGLYVPTVFDPTTGTPIAGTGEWYDVHARSRLCSNGRDATGACNPGEHALHDRGAIDLYFSPTARPMEPPTRRFAVLDYEGRTDEFHENDQPQPRLHPANVPPDADVNVLG